VVLLIKICCIVKKGDQSHTEWIEFKELGPNYGKNAEFLEWGPPPKAPINAHKKKPADTTYNEALNAPYIREGLEIVKKRKARDYCLHGDSIERNLKKAKTVSYSSKFLMGDFNRPQMDLAKSLLFTGRSGTGKTQWALAHFKNPLFCSHIDKLKTLTPDHDGIVFDDMSFDHWPPESVIHLLDIEVEREIHIRYGTVTIPAYVPKIFTTNKLNPFYKFDADSEQIVAIERRYTRVSISTPLFGIYTIFDANTNSAFDAMVGAHRPINPAFYPRTERFAQDDAAIPLDIVPVADDEPSWFSPEELAVMNQTD